MIRIITHDGTFHSDDVFAVAALKKILDPHEVEIKRTRDPQIIEVGDYVVDVGGIYDPAKNRFDHHQEGGAGLRENGIKYSSFGLVWKKFGEDIAGSREIADRIERKLVVPIDAIDNGQEIIERKIKDIGPYTISDIVFAFRPSWRESGGDYLSEFYEAVKFAGFILDREIISGTGELEANRLAEEDFARAEDKRVVFLSKHYPWYEVMDHHKEVLYVLYQQNENTWRLRAVPESLDSFTPRKMLPAAWAGKERYELADETGVPDALFCHNNRFVAVAGSKEGILKLAELALKDNGD